jgi:hypothetical protein
VGEWSWSGSGARVAGGGGLLGVAADRVEQLRVVIEPVVVEVRHPRLAGGGSGMGRARRGLVVVGKRRGKGKGKCVGFC